MKANGFLELLTDERFWEGLREEITEQSPPLRSQRDRPEAWKAFYQKVAASFSLFWGDPTTLGREMATMMEDERIVEREDRIVEVGSGSGWLSLSLAERGFDVTALDYTHPMLTMLMSEAEARGIADRIHTICEDFERFQPRQPFDVTLAVCFPPALTPEGIERLERWSRKRCVVVLGTTRESFPFQQKLFEYITGGQGRDKPLLLLWLLGYLLSRRRVPEMRRFLWKSEVTMPIDEIATFYEAYIPLLGFSGTSAREFCLAHGKAPADFKVSFDFSVLSWDIS